MEDETSDVCFDFGAANSRLLVLQEAVSHHGFGVCHINMDEVVLPICQSIFPIIEVTKVAYCMLVTIHAEEFIAQARTSISAFDVVAGKFVG